MDIAPLWTVSLTVESALKHEPPRNEIALVMTFSAEASQRVGYPVMRHEWESLSFLHWSYPIEVVQALLPVGVTVQPYGGRAWVGLVPFHLVVTLPGLPSVPWMARFPETNVRTYVVDDSGRPGIWFFSLDADRLCAVVAARAGYRLPYFWSAMTLDRVGNEVTYRSRRSWPGPRGAISDIRVEVGERLAVNALNPFDHYLTARWTLFSAHRRGLHYADAYHPPWPLHSAEVIHVRQNLFEAAGLPSPEGPPIAHYSPTVTVDIGLPHRVEK